MLVRPDGSIAWTDASSKSLDEALARSIESTVDEDRELRGRRGRVPHFTGLGEIAGRCTRDAFECARCRVSRQRLDAARRKTAMRRRGPSDDGPLHFRIREMRVRRDVLRH
jgi:hypothetical protein